MQRFKPALIAALLAVFAQAAYGQNATVESACFKGEPVSQFFDEITVIENKGYVVGFAPETRTPIWTCYRLFDVEDPPQLTRPKKKFSTYRDGDLEVKHSDYTNSGFDRGHMAPSSGIGKCYGRSAQLGTFKTTNICPQHPGLNQRCWERFERQVSDYYAEQMAEVWVITGPIFGDACIELESEIRVPEAFYKIVVAQLESKVEMLALIMPNERTEKSKIGRFVHTVDEIEDLTGIDFFGNLPDDEEELAEAREIPHTSWNADTWELRPTFAGTPRTIRIRECD